MSKLGSWRRGGAATLLCLSMTSGALALGADVAHAAGVTLTGTLTAAGGITPAGGITINVIDGEGTSFGTVTAADGTYVLTGVEGPAATFTAHDDSGTYAAIEQEVQITGDPTVHDVQLALGGTITGHVRSASGDPIPGVCLSVQSIGGYTISGDLCTDSNGAYTTHGLPPDQYSVYFSASLTAYFSEYYDDRVTFEASDDVVVVAGAATVADAVLQSGAHIVGTITAADGSPLAHASIRFESPSSYLDLQADTDAAGRYASPALPPGEYHVHIRPDDDVHLERYVGGTDDPATASEIVVATTDVTVDSSVVLGGAITGTIRDSFGAPIVGACAYVTVEDGVAAGCAGANGVYRVGGLPTGTYALSFLADTYEIVDVAGVGVTVSATTSGVNATLQRRGVISGTVTDGPPLGAGEVWAYAVGDEFPSATALIEGDGSYELVDLQPGSYVVVARPPLGTPSAATAYPGVLTFAAATPLAVGLDVEHTGIDIELVTGATISGTVTSTAAGGAPIAGACVGAQPVSGMGNVGEACTNASGQYTITGLGPSGYTLLFVGPNSGPARYAAEYWNNMPLNGTPTTLNVTVAGPNVANAALTPLVAVTGTVRNAANAQPIAGVTVNLRGPSPSTALTVARTNASGAYTAFVPTGTFTVEARGNVVGYQNSSRQVVVGAGGAIEDFGLSPRSSIRGTVTSGGQPVSGMLVSAFTSADTDNEVNSAFTASDGSFSMLLDPGTYVVRAVDLKSRYLGEWYANATSPATATPIVVVAGAVTIGMDVTRGGAIEGTIADSVDQPRDVVVYPAIGGAPVATFTSRLDGVYVSPPLPAGQYKLGASVDGQELFYGGPTFASAAVVTVAAGRSAGHIDLPTTLVITNAVRDLTATPGNGQVALAWSAPSPLSSPVVEYRVEMSANGGASWSIVDDVPAAATVVGGLANGSSYQFRVTALLHTGVGQVSSIAVAEPGVVPGVPGAVSLVADNVGVTATWSAPASNGGYAITDYAIERSSDGGSTWTVVAHTPSPSTTATIPLAPGNYVVRVAAVNIKGAGPTTSPSNIATVTSVSSQPGTLTPPFAALAAPARILDTRADGQTVDGAFQAIGQRAGGSVLALQVAGRAGILADAGSVVLNVSVVAAAGDGYVTTFPCGVTRPVTASVNFSTGQTVANQVIAKIGTGGQVCFFTYAATDLVVDVAGAFPTGSSYEPLAAPARMLDTRPAPEGATADGIGVGGGRRGAGTVLELPIAGRAGVPADATSIVLNIAAVAPSDPGFITIFPCGVSRPNAANLNFVAGRNVANAVIAKVGAGGKVCIFTSAATDVVVDVSGDFTSFTSFAPLTAPARLLDTRPPPDGATIDGQTVGVGRRTGGTVFELPVAGRAGVPGDAGTVVLNVTAVSPSGPGYLTVYPCGVPRPNAANVTYVTGQIVPNAVIAKLGDGKVCVFTYATTDLVIDVAGTLV